MRSFGHEKISRRHFDLRLVLGQIHLYLKMSKSLLYGLQKKLGVRTEKVFLIIVFPVDTNQVFQVLDRSLNL